MIGSPPASLWQGSRHIFKLDAASITLPSTLNVTAPEILELLWIRPDTVVGGLIWLARQIRLRNGRILDMIGIDAHGRLIGVDVYCSASPASAFSSGIAQFIQLKDEAEELKKSLLGEGAILSTHNPGEVAIVLVIADASRLKRELRALQEAGVNVFAMEFDAFCFNGEKLVIFNRERRD